MPLSARNYPILRVPPIPVKGFLNSGRVAPHYEVRLIVDNALLLVEATNAVARSYPILAAWERIRKDLARRPDYRQLTRVSGWPSCWMRW
jgi:hypothetical protein